MVCFVQVHLSGHCSPVHPPSAGHHYPLLPYLCLSQGHLYRLHHGFHPTGHFTTKAKISRHWTTWQQKRYPLYINIFKTHKTCVLIKLSLLVQSGSAFITLDGIVDVMRTTKKLRDVVRDLGLNIRIFHVKPVQPDTLTGAAKRRLRRVDTVNSTGSPLCQPKKVDFGNHSVILSRWRTVCSHLRVTWDDTHNLTLWDTSGHASLGFPNINGETEKLKIVFSKEKKW